MSIEIAKKLWGISLTTDTNNLDQKHKSINNKAKQIYFCNRFDSSPFYEPTYENKFSIIDYLIVGYNFKLTQNSGIHTYLMDPRRLFGKRKIRPLSSNYFDLILEKIRN